MILLLGVGTFIHSPALLWPPKADGGFIDDPLRPPSLQMLRLLLLLMMLWHRLVLLVVRLQQHQQCNVVLKVWTWIELTSRAPFVLLVPCCCLILN